MSQELRPFELDDTNYQTTYTKKFLGRKRYAPPDPKKMLAYIPGIIRMIHVKPGQKVKWGDQILILEAMKMKNDVTAPIDGTIKAVYVEVGAMVAKNQLLIEFE